MLKESIQWDAEGVVRGLVPTESLPVTPSVMLAAMSKGPNAPYQRKNKKWNCAPCFDQQNQEEAIANFLQSITTFIHNHYATEGTPQSRSWTAAYHDTPLGGGMLDRSPDICLIDGPGCVGVKINVEHKSSVNLMGKAVKQLHDGALNCLSTQDDRLYFIGIAIANTKFRVVVHHRSGCIVSSPADINRDAVVFVRLLAGLALLGKENLGYDPSIEVHDGKRYVTVSKTRYEIMEVLHKAETINGRATVCWRCRREGDDTDYVIKSLWQDTSRTHEETDFLTAATKAGVEGIPISVAQEVVMWQGEPITTKSLVAALCGPKGKVPQNMEDRRFTRYVMKGYGVRLSKFSSKIELISAMIDYVTALEGLHEKADIIHADICDKNLMLKPGNGSELRRGLLIDFDYARFGSEQRTHSAVGVKTGTATFAPCDLLLFPDIFPHEPYHDLESLLYVLVWYCSVYTGPEITGRVFKILETPLGDWVSNREDHVIGALKESVMRLRPEPFNTIVFERFLNAVIEPHFADLKTCICEWRAIVMRRDVQAPTHAEVIEVLRRCLDALKVAAAQAAKKNKSDNKSSVSPPEKQPSLAPRTEQPAMQPPPLPDATLAPAPRLSSQRRKNAVQNINNLPVDVPTSVARLCEGCDIPFKPNAPDAIQCASKDDCCSPPGWFCLKCAELKGLKRQPKEWFCPTCLEVQAATREPKAKRRR